MMTAPTPSSLPRSPCRRPPRSPSFDMFGSFLSSATAINHLLPPVGWHSIRRDLVAAACIDRIWRARRGKGGGAHSSSGSELSQRQPYRRGTATPVAA
uniref:Uncharacterized protein n=1 Tax=Oryza punctata TaxID=4537 RepID=A0A0E0LNK0_ORYPU